MISKILEVKGLNKHFGGLHAVKDLYFDLFQGINPPSLAPMVQARVPSLIY